jgi:hypothetical protein
MTIETVTPEMTEDQAMASLMASMGPPEGDPEVEADEDEDEEDEQTSADGDEPDAKEPEDEDEDGDDDDDETAPVAITDETEISVEIDGEAQAFTVAQLKDFAAGQGVFAKKDEALTQTADQTAVVLQTAIDIVSEDLKPYENVDWMQLQAKLTPAEFSWHRENAKRAHERFSKLVGSATNFEETLGARKATVSAVEVQQSIQVLQRDIDGWNDELYGEIMDYAVSAGLPEADVLQLTNPTVIKLLNNARLYAKGSKVAAQKIKEVPAKVLKSGNRDTSGTGSAALRKAQKRVKDGTASEQDALQALMSRL